ncbi:ciliary microtubule-associated protein 2-like [Convolutriloba macropyga]|uniref:ciliary microtubule-associated protein 2-like n=1 Tax=Convolutriloba macropyga TaxID=536237 RepID=UPI003F5267D3
MNKKSVFKQSFEGTGSSRGSTVAPGTYEYTTEIDEKTHKQVGSRGPYDLFTASRSAPICNGHLAQQKPVKNRGPADYETKSFVEDLVHTSHAHIGEFKKLDQYPRIPGERIFYTKPTQAPVDPGRPGPGYYESSGAISVDGGEYPAPFLQSADRFDERAKLMMMGPSVRNVGVGRYDLTKYAKHQSKNGNKSSFKSKVPILLEPTQDKIIKERLKPHTPSAKRRVVKTQSRVIEDAILSKKMLNQ